MADVNFSLTRVDVINLFAEDLMATKAFYQEVLRLPLLFENENHAVFKTENMIVSLWDVPGGRDLTTPVPVADPAAGSRFALAMSVNDVDAACTALAQRGVDFLNGPVDRPWGVRTASFADPAGHVWEISQDLD
jgi:lactoylglutathione lyase